MTQEEKDLLLKDLCARLPYAPKGVYSLKCDSMHPITFNHLTTRYIDRFTTEQSSYTDEIIDIKLYLRSMSSMTEEELEDLLAYSGLIEHELEISKYDGGAELEFWVSEAPCKCVIKVIDWLNAHHFDYRALIYKGLALEAPEDMYKSK